MSRHIFMQYIQLAAHLSVNTVVAIRLWLVHTYKLRQREREKERWMYTAFQRLDSDVHVSSARRHRFTFRGDAFFETSLMVWYCFGFFLPEKKMKTKQHFRFFLIKSVTSFVCYRHENGLFCPANCPKPSNNPFTTMKNQQILILEKLEPVILSQFCLEKKEKYVND